MVKRRYTGIYNLMSPKHLQRYVLAFAGRHKIGGKDSIDQMTAMVPGLERKRLRYRDLVE